MENEKKRLPEWLQDRKKCLIIAIVILALILSFVVKIVLGSIIIDSAIIKKTGLKLGINNIKITNIFTSKQRLNGTYMNDYVDEELYFHKNGSLEYTSGENFAMGSYELDGSKLILTINGVSSEFEIVEKTENTLVFTSGGNIFSFTKE